MTEMVHFLLNFQAQFKWTDSKSPQKLDNCVELQHKEARFISRPVKQSDITSPRTLSQPNSAGAAQLFPVTQEVDVTRG